MTGGNGAVTGRKKLAVHSLRHSLCSLHSPFTTFTVHYAHPFPLHPTPLAPSFGWRDEWSGWSGKGRKERVKGGGNETKQRRDDVRHEPFRQSDEGTR